MPRFLLPFFILLLSSACQAFVNIEGLRQSRQEGWFGSTGLSSSGSQGNVNVFRLGLNTFNILKSDSEEYILSGLIDYGEASGSPIINNSNIHLRYARRVNWLLQWEIFSQAESNEFQFLALRTLNGGGLRWRIYKDPKRSFFLGTGLYYEDERVINDENQANFRGNFYLSFRQFIDELLEITLIAYYQPSQKSFLDYRVRANLGLEFKMSESLRWTNEIRYFADTRPPVTVQKEDLAFLLGVNLTY